MTIKVDQGNATEDRFHNWVTEASTLGLKPGEIASSIETTLGNRQPFLVMRIDEDRVTYLQDCGCLMLIVLND